LREETAEVALAAETESDERLAEEAADVLYHLLVLLRSRDVGLDAVEETLNGRRR
jgi:phosphoribosyl-ATP pyrophosphohydrolase/phosphoribosyl-AMP cyclohydrolase